MLPGGSMATCPYCPTSFTRKANKQTDIIYRQDIINHFKEEHGIVPGSCYSIRFCDMCSFVTSSGYAAYQKHRKCHELSVVYKCNRCLYLSSTLQGILLHVSNTYCSHRDWEMIRKPGVSLPRHITEKTHIQVGGQRYTIQATASLGGDTHLSVKNTDNVNTDQTLDDKDSGSLSQGEFPNWHSYTSTVDAFNLASKKFNLVDWLF